MWGEWNSCHTGIITLTILLITQCRRKKYQDEDTVSKLLYEDFLDIKMIHSGVSFLDDNAEKIGLDRKELGILFFKIRGEL